MTAGARYRVWSQRLTMREQDDAAFQACVALRRKIDRAESRWKAHWRFGLVSPKTETTVTEDHYVVLLEASHDLWETLWR